MVFVRMNIQMDFTNLLLVLIFQQSSHITGGKCADSCLRMNLDLRPRDSLNDSDLLYNCCKDGHKNVS